MGKQIDKFLLFRSNFPETSEEFMCIASKSYKIIFETEDTYYIVSEQGEKFGIGKEDLEDDLYVVVKN